MEYAVTIFYENSAGFISQWTGRILVRTATTIDIQFSANKALRYDLKANCGFMLVTKHKVKSLGVAINEAAYAASQDENLRAYIRREMHGNIAYLWNGTEFEATA